jgi:hypothetical protein
MSAGKEAKLDDHIIRSVAILPTWLAGFCVQIFITGWHHAQ